MQLFITCEFGTGTQTFLKEGATDADVQALSDAMHGDPDAVIAFVGRLTPDGPDRERLVRASRIRSVEAG